MGHLWQQLKIAGRYIGLVNKNEYICNEVSGKTVLHVGCADYPITQERIINDTLLHTKITKVAKQCLGIDTSREGIQILKEHGFNNIMLYDGEQINKLNMNFDVIVAGDVLEHMTNPSALLKSVATCLIKNGELIISVPNAYSWNVLRFLMKRFEPTHIDHCFYFSVKTLSELCRRFNLVPVELAFTTQPPQEDNRKLYLIIRDLLINMNPKMSPTLIMKFRRLEDCGVEDMYFWP